MLSVLIPVYNYNIQDLVLKLLKELFISKIEFEIICLDDCSSVQVVNEAVLPKEVKILKNNVNLGRTETRQKLAVKAKYDWLLFLDADVLPVSDSFINKYVEAISNKDFKVCFGGFKYQDKKPPHNKILRWKYGTLKESISAKKRNSKPYKTIISANLLIQKEVFLETNKNLKGNLYGYDNIFSIKLKQRSVIVYHIDNPVFHMGLEDNKSYLKKKELAAETIYKSYLNKEISNSDNGLLKMFFLLKKLYLVRVISMMFEFFKDVMKRNILSENPSIFLLNCYRLGYFCSLKYS